MKQTQRYVLQWGLNPFKSYSNISRLRHGGNFSRLSNKCMAILVQGNRLPHMSLVERKQLKPDTLRHAHFSRLYVKVRMLVHFEAEAAYSCHPHLLAVSDQKYLFPGRNTYPVMDVPRIVSDVVSDPVIGNPKLIIWWSYRMPPGSLTVIQACKLHTSYSYPTKTRI